MSGPGLASSFQYDAFGRRISKTINSASVSFLYNGANIVQEKVGTTVSANLLVGGIDEVFTRSDSSGTSGFIKDALGSTLALTNSSGAIQTEYVYEPFGKTTVSGTASNNTSKYTGREDEGTGLYFYRARYYSPSLQRFISEDPIEFEAGDVNLYGYVENDPINFIDPSGLEKEGGFWDWVWDDPHIGFGDGGDGPYAPVLMAGGWFAALRGALALARFARAVGRVARIIRRVCRIRLNPFRGKSPSQLDKMFRNKGFEPRGPDPLGGKGGYVNPRSGRSYHIDPGGKYKKGCEPPHVDVNRPRGYKGFPKRKFPR